jgi:ComF family protein
VGKATPLQSAVTLADAALALLLAPSCAACREPLEAPTAGAVCAGCWARIVPITAPFCDACGDPLGTWRDTLAAGGRCLACRHSSSSVTRARSVGAYDGALRDVIHALKYDRRPSIAARLGDLMRVRGADVLSGADLCVPVPLHVLRRWTRGFNQAAELAGRLGLPVAHALRRVRRTASQADLPAARRHANVRGAFAARRRADVRGKVVVLVDDVTTTGATLEACAVVLLDRGAAEVRALTAAKAVLRRP